MDSPDYSTIFANRKGSARPGVYVRGAIEMTVWEESKGHPHRFSVKYGALVRKKTGTSAEIVQNEKKRPGRV